MQHAYGALGAGAVQPDGRHRAVAVEPVRVATRVVDRGAIAVQRAAQLRRQAPLDAQRLEAVLAPQAAEDVVQERRVAQLRGQVLGMHGRLLA